MKKIGIIINPKRARSKKTFSEINNLAKEFSLDLFTDQNEMSKLLNITYLPSKEFLETIDLVFAMGGDGTVLYAAKKMIGSNIPILGINLGGLGFLSGVGERQIDLAFKSIIKKEFKIINQNAIALSIVSSKKKYPIIPAFNDVVIGWGSSSRLSTLRLIVDEEILGLFSCDGMIISTPSGSTGHSLSNGGPIIHPDIDGFCISAICPHTLSNRPLVIPKNRNIIIEIHRTSKELLLSTDGHDQCTIKEGDYIEIKEHPMKINLLQINGYSYFNTLSKKLNWRGSVI